MLSGNSKNYAGRTVDLLLLKTVQEAPVYKKRVSLDVEDKPMIVSGVEKLVQMYTLVFLTEMGTCHADEGRGTGILADVNHGRIYDMATLTSSAAEANALAKRQVMAESYDDVPPDERLADAEVTELALDKESATAMISVRLTTEAEDSFDYIIPVGIGVGS